MIKRGTTELTILREDYLNGGDKVYPVSVDWECEKSEYGDGSEDVEFTTSAILEDGTEFELIQGEEDALYEDLSENGEI